MAGAGADVSEPTTVAALLAARAADDRVGLVFGEQRWTWREVVAESRRRAELALAMAPGNPGVPFHVGVLLGNVPDYLFWLGGAALAGAVVVGINPTRRGAELERDIRFTECRMLVTDAEGAALLRGLDTGVSAQRTVRVDLDPLPEVELPAGRPAPRAVTRRTLFLLLFTSGTTGAPKAVQCSQGRLADIAHRASEFYGFAADDVCYCPMPLFHGNAVMALWAPALAVGARVALTPRFSASGFLADVRRYGVTRFTYVGRALAYVLATPERPDDARNPLRFGFGTEASARDRREFERRFGCRLVEGYGSSEGGLAINRTPDTPPGALGPAGDEVVVVDPETGELRPRARLGTDGRLENAESAIGELVSRSGGARFEGYWRLPDVNAARTREGWYWTGDLGFVDEDGFVWFAGRSDDWIRVDSENFAAAPVERILERHPEVVTAAVYPVADPRSGDQVMAAVELRPDSDADRFAEGLGRFLADQADLGTKWAPRFVRVSAALPLTASGKITKHGLRNEGWCCAEDCFWRPGPGERSYRRLTAEDAEEIAAAFAAYDRTALLPG
ncbi:MAG TPA: AMP-binding protein [Acidimicrobiales bacterium]|nr:AMP-binding protein [Acidimicrobiales bacterium]